MPAVAPRDGARSTAGWHRGPSVARPGGTECPVWHSWTGWLRTRRPAGMAGEDRCCWHSRGHVGEPAPGWADPTSLLSPTHGGGSLLVASGSRCSLRIAVPPAVRGCSRVPRTAPPDSRAELWIRPRVWFYPLSLCFSLPREPRRCVAAGGCNGCRQSWARRAANAGCTELRPAQLGVLMVGFCSQQGWSWRRAARGARNWTP